MKSLQHRIIITFFLGVGFLFSTSSYSQYEDVAFRGGDGNGYANDGFGDFCDVITVTPFAGGNDDGYTVGTLGDACKVITITPFSGGNNDGYTVGILGDTCEVITVTPFAGGFNDGFAIGELGDACDVITVTPFAGGDYGGANLYENDNVDLETCEPLIPLPIVLLSFEANREEDSIRLDWTTLSERNNDYFTLEHSMTGSDWKPFMKVNGAGTSTERLDYTNYHLQPKIGVNYYRLKQTDFDGEYTYSAIRSVLFENTSKLLKVYPNPTAGIITVDLGTNDNSKVDFLVFSPTGKLLQTHSVYVDKDFQINLGDYAKGIYLLRVILEGETQTFRIVKF